MKSIFLLFPILCLTLFSCQRPAVKDYDIIVYGGTSSGVIAAYSAKLEGKKVLIIEPGKHLGGLSSGGLGQTDIGNKYAVTGLARNFYRRLGDHYGKLEAWKFEPHVAEGIFKKYISEANVDVLFDFRLTGVKMDGERIISVELEHTSAPAESTNRTISGSCFIDCSYEGDLMAAASVSYTVGRESNDRYGETYNGVQLREEHQFPDDIDPYIVPGDASSGLCWGIQASGVAPRGTGDTLVQAYNYRLCLTQDPDNRVPVTMPEDYDPARFELLRRVILQRAGQGKKQNLDDFLILSPMPRGKTDINNKGPVSTDAIGMNYDYPEGGYKRRQEIVGAVENYTKQLLYFLGNDEAVPENVRTQMLSWGWAADEFPDHGNFPHQIYIREARRMIGEYVMTQHNCQGDSTVSDAIALAAYTMDSHNCQRVIMNGMVKNEGDVQIGGFPPYDISYRSLTPRRGECINLLVPVCLSATHIAFGSIRMEPVFMVLGQVSGLASAMALDKNIPVQDVDAGELKQRLTANPLQNGTAPDIVVDNSDSAQVTVEGSWEVRDYWMGQNKADHLFHAPSSRPGSVTFRPDLGGREGRYALYMYIPRKPWGNSDFERYSNKVKVETGTAAKKEISVHDINPYTFDWAPLGKMTLQQGDYIRIIADDPAFPVPADAILLVSEK